MSKNANIYISCIIALLFTSCVNKISYNNELPNWVIKPMENCKDGYLCATGEGDNILSASANARNELAKQFSVSVNSDTIISIKQQDDVSKAKASYSVNESVNEVMSGSKIEQTFKDSKGIVYAFAVIDKAKIEKELLTEINDVDHKMSALFSSNPLPVKTIKTLIKARDEKSAKYLSLTGNKIPEKFTLNDVKKAKSANSYSLNIENDDIGLQSFLRNEIFDHYDKIDPKATKIVKGKVDLEKQYLNVEGFEKYNISIDLSCVENGKTIGSIKIDKSANGRSKQHVLDKLKEQIFEDVSQKIDSLLM